ncbi:MAG TPA: helix-turn-helix transcriptional regulator [Chryseolinea sp.]|nr:helix-turn-helix transcriptional regulator [Chryseolinea sp.]
MKPVTPTEWKILKLVATGHSTNEVAGLLGISRHTVLSHRRSLLLKFDASNSADLVRKAMARNGSEVRNPDNEFDFLT